MARAPDTIQEMAQKQQETYMMFRNLLIAHHKEHWEEGQSEDDAREKAETFMYQNDAIYRMWCEGKLRAMAEERPLKESESDDE